ncbi:CD1871A family CXXC motif-containing protein [Slackia piriformis]
MPRVKRGKARSFAWVLVLAIGVALIALGIAQGDMLDTWRKASLICYECIGIG